VSSSAPIAFPDFALEVGSPSCAQSKALYWVNAIFCPAGQVIVNILGHLEGTDGGIGDAALMASERTNGPALVGVLSACKWKGRKERWGCLCRRIEA
jgi:hypothetical protein